MNPGEGHVENPETWPEESFVNEKRAYNILRDFQGRTIPRCYGAAWWLRPDMKRVNALVLEYIEGLHFDDLDMETKKTHGKIIADNARAAVRALKTLRIFHGDIRTPNLLIKPDLSVVLLDFGSCTLDVTDYQWDQIFLDRGMAALNEELHLSEIDVKGPSDPQCFYRKSIGYIRWNRFVENQPATWREKYYRYIEGAGSPELRWALKDDIPEEI